MHTEPHILMPIPMPCFPTMPFPIPPSSGGHWVGMVVGEEFVRRVSRQEWWGVEFGVKMAR